MRTCAPPLTIAAALGGIRPMPGRAASTHVSCRPIVPSADQDENTGTDRMNLPSTELKARPRIPVHPLASGAAQAIPSAARATPRVHVNAVFRCAVAPEAFGELEALTRVARRVAK